MMAGIRGKNTKLEMLIRSELHRRGFRFQLYRKNLPGKPDLVFPKYGAVLFVNGCFWHGHDCHLFKWPKSRDEFWRRKIEENRTRDVASVEALSHSGWRVGKVWECALKGREKRPFEEVVETCARWLQSPSKHLNIKGESR